MESLNVVFAAPNEVVLQSEPIAAPDPGQILIETHKSLISTGTECIVLGQKFSAGTHWDRWVKWPFQPGYLNAGQVIAVGTDVEEFRIGDRVATRLSHHQYHTVEAARALLIPDGVDSEEAAWFGLATIVQNGVRKAELIMGDTVVIIGLGLLGQLAVQYARAMGARDIIAIDTAPVRLAMAMAHGATHILEVPVGEAKAQVLAITEGRLADVVFDVTGHHAVFPHALGLARRFGKVLLLGDTGSPEEQRLTSDVMTRGVRIIGAHDMDPPAMANDYHFWTRENMARLFFTYLQRGQMRVTDLVTHRFSPQDAPQAYHVLQTERSTAMGVVFDWTQI
jgi:2-desacetyl-2-hydroxyethyl bacteriochlorophyllide A dehydrogenase